MPRIAKTRTSAHDHQHQAEQAKAEFLADHPAPEWRATGFVTKLPVIKLVKTPKRGLAHGVEDHSFLRWRFEGVAAKAS